MIKEQQFPEIDYLVAADESFSVGSTTERVLGKEDVSARTLNIISEKMYIYAADRTSEDLLAEIPTVVTPDYLSPLHLSLISRLVFDGYSHEIIDRLPQNMRLDTYLNTPDVVLLFQHFLEEGFGYELLSHLDLQFSLADEPKVVLDFLAQCIGYDLYPVLGKQLVIEGTIDKYSEKHELLFKSLIKKGQTFDILLLFEGPLEDFSPEIAWLVVAELVREKGTSYCLDLLPKSFIFSRNSRGRDALITELLGTEYAEEVFNGLQLPLYEKASLKWFRKIARSKAFKEVYGFLPQTIDLERLSISSGEALADFIAQHPEESEQLWAKLSRPFNLSMLSSGAFVLLSRYIHNGHFLEIKSFITEKISLNTNDIGPTVFIESMIDANLTAESSHLLELTNVNVDISTQGTTILKSLLLHLECPQEVRDFVAEALPNLESRIRASHDVDVIPEQKVGPHLFEQVEKLPLTFGSVVKARGNWFKGFLQKIGVNDRTTVYVKYDNDFKVVFRNDGMNKASMLQLKNAMNILPEYVSSAYYSELSTETIRDIGSKTYEDGHREVYAGAALDSLDLEAFPANVAKDILEQKKYIVLRLAYEGVIHQDMHEGNMNGRFLLTSQEGDKELYLDPNLALVEAANGQKTITPIVTLRDWAWQY